MFAKTRIIPSESNPTLIYFGEHNPLILKSKIEKRKYIIVTSSSHIKNGNLNSVFSSVDKKPEALIENVPPNPSLDFLESEIHKLGNLDIDVVVAVGGGSCIDSGKAFARCLKNGNTRTLRSMLDAAQDQESFDSIPLIAIPTTAGTGAEVTPFATIWDHENLRKLSLTGKDLYPETALIFPILCLSAPSRILLAAALDAVSHAMDAIWNKKASQFSNANATQALNILSTTLLDCDFKDLNIDEIMELSLGSLYAGLAISECRTSLSHSISYSLTSTFGLPHGIACAFTLPAIAEYAVQSGILTSEQFIEEKVGTMFFNSHEYFNQVFYKHGVAEIFREFISNQSEVFELISEMHHPDRVINFPIQVTSPDLHRILEKALSFIFKK